MKLAKIKRGMVNASLAFLLIFTIGIVPLGQGAFARDETVSQEAILDEPEFTEEKKLPDEEGFSEEEGVSSAEEGSDEVLSVENEGDEAIAAISRNGVLRANALTQLKNLSWNMYRASNGNEPDRDLGLDPASYRDGFTNYETAYVVMKFDIEAPVGGFQLGDTLEFPFFQGDDIAFIDTAEENLFADDGQTVLGTWKIFKRNIVIELGADAVGKTSLNNCTIVTAKTLHPYNQTVDAVAKDYTIGTVSHTYKINELKRSLIRSDMAKNLSSTTNQSVRWLIGVGANFVSDLTSSGGASMRSVSSLIFEDEIPASEASTGISDVYITARVPFIMSESDQRAASASGTTLLEAGANSYFRRIVQQDSDSSYEIFKSRIEPMQYGTYEVGDGSYKFIINFGDPHAAGQGVTYSDLFPDLEQSIMNANKGVSEREAEIIARSLGDDNSIGGNVVFWMFYIITGYNQAFVDTQKHNTGELSFLGEDGETVVTDSAQGTLQAGSAIASPAARQATIAKADGVTGAPLEGVVFKLQRTEDNGVTWADVSGSQVTTGSNGQVTTRELDPGTYRFVEVSGLRGYDTQNVRYSSSTDETDGVFTISIDDAKGVIVTATNTPKYYTVIYNTDEGTEVPAKTGVRYDDTHLLPPSNPIKPGKNFVGWVVDESGTQGTHNGQIPTGDTKYSEISDTEDTLEITLKAVWEDKTYTVNYDTNGGDQETLPAKENVGWNDDGLLPSEEPTKEGHIFVGWEVSVGSPVGSSVESASRYSAIALDDEAEGVTLKALWDTKEAVALTGVTVNETLVGTLPDEEAFTFEMTLVSGEPSGVTIPDPVATEPSVTGDATATFGELVFTQAGTYTFEVTEVMGNTDLLAYDDSVITMTIVVTEDATTFTVNEPTFTINGQPSDLLFVNVYSEPSDPGNPDNPDNLENSRRSTGADAGSTGRPLLPDSSGQGTGGASIAKTSDFLDMAVAFLGFLIVVSLGVALEAFRKRKKKD